MTPSAGVSPTSSALPGMAHFPLSARRTSSIAQPVINDGGVSAHKGRRTRKDRSALKGSICPRGSPVAVASISIAMVCTAWNAELHHECSWRNASPWLRCLVACRPRTQFALRVSQLGHFIGATSPASVASRLKLIGQQETPPYNSVLVCGNKTTSNDLMQARQREKSVNPSLGSPRFSGMPAGCRVKASPLRANVICGNSPGNSQKGNWFDPRPAQRYFGRQKLDKLSYLA